MPSVCLICIGVRTSRWTQRSLVDAKMRSSVQLGLHTISTRVWSTLRVLHPVLGLLCTSCGPSLQPHPLIWPQKLRWGSRSLRSSCGHYLRPTTLGLSPISRSLHMPIQNCTPCTAKTLLRGVDLTVALAAQQQGLIVKAVSVWFRDRPEPKHRATSVGVPPAPPDGDAWDDDDEARPIDQRPLVGLEFRAPDDDFINDIKEVAATAGRIVDPKSLRWVNFPQHFAAGAVFDAEHMSGEEEDRLCAWVALALLIGPPTAANPDEPHVPLSPDEEEADDGAEDASPSLKAFQDALEIAFTSIPWMCQGKQILRSDDQVRVGVLSEPPFVQHFPQRATADLPSFLAACLPASFGRGKEAVTDESYRKALALEVDRVAVNWHPAGQMIQIIERLLTPNMPPLRAVLEKVNVYGPGNFFKSHVDTPRDVNMVGTLVVCLPTPHTGGELRLKHEGKEVVVDMSDASAATPTIRWCAFFSDVEHEVLAVTSGYRVTLTYDLLADLVQPTASDGVDEHILNFGPVGQLVVLPRELPATRPASAGAVQSVLDQLTRILGIPRSQWVGIFCSHAYPLTPRGLVDHKLLKGVDALLWRALTDEGYDRMLKQVYRFDPEQRLAEETDPNQPPCMGANWEGRRFDRYAIAGNFTEFYTGGGSDGNEPPWHDAHFRHRAADMPAVASGITFLNQPHHMLAVGAWDHIMGNWPQQSEVFYGTVAMLVRVPTHKGRAWNRRKHAVVSFAAGFAH
jgi:hypothetical protein